MGESLYLNTPLSSREIPHPLVFVHIPKTGGTSLVKALKSSLPRHSVEMFTDNQSLAVFRDAQSLDELSPSRVLGGHICLPEFRQRGFEGWAFSVLRDPRDRINSHYRFLSKSRHPDHRGFRFQEPEAFIEYLRQNEIYSNIQCRYIAGRPCAHEAKRVLESDRVIAVSLDQIDAIAEALTGNWSSPMRVPRLNVSSARSEAIHSELLDSASDLYDQDLELFEYVQSQADKMLARARYAVERGEITLSPRRGVGHQLAMGIWHNPAVRSALGPIMRTRAGAEIRQRGVRLLVARAAGHSASDPAGYPSGMSEIVLSSQGHCPSCDTDVSFVAKQEWLRDYFVCTNCGSIPRERALMRVIEMYYPNWRELRIHESSPGGRGTSIRLSKECKHYTATHYDTKVPFGTMHPSGHYQSEDLEDQTFDDESFDLVISQDVMEHVFDPDQACREIARTLRPGGAHIFTTPLVNKHNPTQRRAGLKDDGSIDYLCEPEYHGNPIDSTGSLVTFHWGYDITEWIFAACGHATTLICIDDLSMGIRAEFIEVCMTKKPSVES